MGEKLVKYCNGCEKVKPLTEFSKEARAKNGYKPRCKECMNAYYNANYHKYKQDKLRRLKEYYKENQEVILQKVRNYKQDPEQKIITKRIWREKNRLKIRERQNKYVRTRLIKDPSFAIQRRVRSAIYKLLNSRDGRTFDLLGYSLNDLLDTLGVDNIHDKHIDHKIPLSWFLVDTPIKISYHLNNLHLLGKSENVRKHNTFCDPVPRKYYKSAIDFIKPEYKNLIKIEHGNEK